MFNGYPIKPIAGIAVTKKHQNVKIDIFIYFNNNALFYNSLY